MEDGSGDLEGMRRAHWADGIENGDGRDAGEAAPVVGNGADDGCA
jgi:hypothetical protein